MAAKQDPYTRIRRHDPYWIRKVAEVGSCVTCAAPRGADESDEDYRLRLGAAAERHAAEIVADLLDYENDL